MAEDKNPLDFDDSIKGAENIRKELGFIDDTLTSISLNIKNSINKELENSSDLVKKGIAQSFSRDLTKAIDSSNKSINSQIKLLNRANKGVNISKKIIEEIIKIETDRDIILQKLNNLQKQGINLNNEHLVKLLESYEAQLDNLDAIQEYNKNLGSSVGLINLIQEGAGSLLDRFDKTGILSKLIKGELSQIQKSLLLSQITFGGILYILTQSSAKISLIQKDLGLTYSYSRDLQISFGYIAISSEKLFITTEKLSKSFRELSQLTGLIANFGSETLITYSTLSSQIGLSSEQSKTLTLLSRIQGKNTEDILKSTIETVNAISKQHKVGINVKKILEEIGDISESIQVSLGKSTKKLAEAATQARILGLNLSEVDKIADSLLDFESSIVNELEAELLLGVNLNLEKARLLALNNDLAGLAQELTNQEELRLSFSKGNRIQQEAAAKAIGISRDQLAKMVLQQDLNRMSVEGFVEAYGQATYESLSAMSASEKFLKSLEKIKGTIEDIGIVFAPILDAVASFVGLLTSSKTALSIIGGLMAGIATYQTIILAKQGLMLAKSMAIAVAEIWKGQGSIPIVGIAAAVAGVAAMFGAVAIAKNYADDMVSLPGYGNRILSTPKGTISLNNKDTVIAGTDLGINPIENKIENGLISATPQPQIIQEITQEPIKVPDNKKELEKTNNLLKMILEKSGIVQIDSIKAGTAFSMGTYQVQ